MYLNTKKVANIHIFGALLFSIDSKVFIQPALYFFKGKTYEFILSRLLHKSNVLQCTNNNLIQHTLQVL